MRRISVICWSAYVGLIFTLAFLSFFGDANSYDSPAFLALLAIVDIGLLGVIVVRRMWYRWKIFVLHLSFVLFLLAGIVSERFARTGFVMLYPGQKTYEFVDDDSFVDMLPFEVELKSIGRTYYPGGRLMRGCEVALAVNGIEELLSTNRVVKSGGYTLFLKSLPENDDRTMIGVRYDYFGEIIMAIAMMMFVVASLSLLFTKRSFLGRRGRGVIVIVALSVGNAMGVLGSNLVDESRMPVIYNGRVAPLNTPAVEFVDKMSEGYVPEGYTPESLLLFVYEGSVESNELPYIGPLHKELMDSLEIDGQYASWGDLHNGSVCKLDELYGVGDLAFRKAVKSLDEKMELVKALRSGELVQFVSDDDCAISAMAIDVELAYNRIELHKIFFILAFLVGITMLLCCVVSQSVSVAWLWVAVVIGLIQLAGYVMRWIIVGHMPVDSTGGTLMLLSILLVCGAVLEFRVSKLTFALGMIFAGTVGLLATLVRTDITQLPPALASPWLTLHVGLVIASYALLGTTCIAAIAAFFMPSNYRRAVEMIRSALMPGVMLLCLGIMTGAIWASTAWGRYWGWDPKEVWALITLMVYAIPLHRNIRWFKSPRNLFVYIILSMLALLMTYFGVNYMASLHSYGG